MVPEVVELIPVVLCHLLTRKRILNRTFRVFILCEMKPDHGCNIGAFNTKEERNRKDRTSRPPREGDRDSDSRTEAREPPAALAEGLQAGQRRLATHPGQQ